jgi:hypothetical protein
MDLFDTLTWAEILVKTTFLGTPTLTVLLDMKMDKKRSFVTVLCTGRVESIQGDHVYLKDLLYLKVQHHGGE